MREEFENHAEQKIQGEIAEKSEEGWMVLCGVAGFGDVFWDVWIGESEEQN
jgi:hypothetical protein